jgi:hypothetical protein
MATTLDAKKKPSDVNCSESGKFRATSEESLGLHRRFVGDDTKQFRPRNSLKR